MHLLVVACPFEVCFDYFMLVVVGAADLLVEYADERR